MQAALCLTVCLLRPIVDTGKLGQVDMSKKNTSKAPRIQFKFWLDCNRDDELLVAETIDELKRQRQFASTIRDGIMLITELRKGKTDLLLRLFPWLADALKAAPGTTSDDDLKGELAELKRLIQQQQRSGGNIENGYLMTPGEKQPAATLAVGSIFATETAAEKKASAGEARAAFTGGMGDLFGGDDDDLWD